MSAVVFAASEVGSARAILPVCQLFNERGLPFIVIDRGCMVSEANAVWKQLKHCPDDTNEIRGFLLDNSVSVLVFSVNIKDPLPLKLARVAKTMNIPTIHVLDYWNAYSFRMQADGGNLFMPSRYVVPDVIAKQAAIKEGINPAILEVLGQPAFSDAGSSYAEASKHDRADFLTSLGLDPEKKIIVFVSEPVAMDYGESERESKNYRGYTERDVISIFYEAVKDSSPSLQVCILPHPREDAASLQKFWRELGGEAVGRVVSTIRGRDMLPFIAAIAGMASTLLYEAWLVGVPVLSLQPSLVQDSFRVMQHRSDVVFHDENKGLVQKTRQWLSGILATSNKRYIRSEALFHQDAAERIFSLINSYIENSANNRAMEKA